MLLPERRIAFTCVFPAVRPVAQLATERRVMWRQGGGGGGGGSEVGCASSLLSLSFSSLYFSRLVFVQPPAVPLFDPAELETAKTGVASRAELLRMRDRALFIRSFSFPFVVQPLVAHRRETCESRQPFAAPCESRDFALRRCTTLAAKPAGRLEARRWQLRAREQRCVFWMSASRRERGATPERRVSRVFAPLGRPRRTARTVCIMRTQCSAQHDADGVTVDTGV